MFAAALGQRRELFLSAGALRVAGNWVEAARE
jgi:hypothetical protein